MNNKMSRKKINDLKEIVNSFCDSSEQDSFLDSISKNYFELYNNNKIVIHSFSFKDFIFNVKDKALTYVGTLDENKTASEIQDDLKNIFKPLMLVTHLYQSALAFNAISVTKFDSQFLCSKSDMSVILAYDAFLMSFLYKLEKVFTKK